MALTSNIDLTPVAHELGLPLASVQRTMELLDDGNTVSFITRFRKDQTGGLDEEQVRRIQAAARKYCSLTERKHTILKSIESQGRLTPEITAEIQATHSPKRLEDLYLPFKPRKQTLATLARQRGLEPLVQELLRDGIVDLEQRASELVSAENHLSSTQDVLAGARHLLAELFSENAELRAHLRRLIERSGRLVSVRCEPPEPRATTVAMPASGATGSAKLSNAPAGDSSSSAPEAREGAEGVVEVGSESASVVSSATSETGESPGVAGVERVTVESSGHDINEVGADWAGDGDETHFGGDDDLTGEEIEDELGEESDEESDDGADEALADESWAAVNESKEAHEESFGGLGGESESEQCSTSTEDAAVSPEGTPSEDGVLAAASTSETGSPGSGTVAGTMGSSDDGTTDANSATGEVIPSPAWTPAAAPGAPAGKQIIRAISSRPSKAMTIAALRAKAAERKAKQREKKRKKLEAAFKDYFNFQEVLTRVPPHRVLALNRGERARFLRVRVETDVDALARAAEELLIPANHRQAEFLRSCVRDALTRLVIPGLEREVRRELTERAELRAVDVFERNLRTLLLQPPVRDRRVLAVDPGFRSGCKMVALDAFGNLLGHGVMYIVGKEELRRDGRARFVDLVRKHQLSVIAIGNGAGCRGTEQVVAEILANELQDCDIAYTIVNEAGTNEYSTSSIGREELPEIDPTLRSAVSIGRRLLDPLSELVKVNPANLGIGQYQHDLKAKHLRDSLDAVVESCVNYVGVDANTASPALLRYVSGLNQLTARRLYDHRREHGPFANRERLKQVPGFGDATYIQSAGFLKIVGGDNPLDATWIHPESYEIACRLLEKLGVPVDSFRRPDRSAVAAPPTPPVSEGHSTIQGSAPEAGLEPTVDTSPPSVQESVAADSTTSSSASDSTQAELAASPRVPSDGAGLVPEPTGESEVPKHSSPTPGAMAVMLPPLAEIISGLDPVALARELDVGELLLRDLLAALSRPGRDPREDLPPPVFRRGIMKLEDLQPGMELSGTVLNVVDFGAFVDIGVSDSGLVHISRLADRYVRDPHEVVSVGDVLRVWVVEVDKPRRRVSLTAIRPGSERPAEPRGRQAHPPRPAGAPPSRGGGEPAARGPQTGGHPARPATAAGRGRPPQQGGRGGRRPATPPPPKRPPRPVTPITKAMEEGKEPMRSFSDLLQFYEKKSKPDDES